MIKITDSSFKSINSIPFVIKNNQENVGDQVFVLGYPLRSSMGDEIKLTNGIISSKSGFQGDITSYQTSVPVQPGNSGGPLFNNQGNLIGIINSKHSKAENASYAIKSTYLLTLIATLSNPPKLQSNNLINVNSLSNQVNLLKEFVYIIEVE